MKSTGYSVKRDDVYVGSLKHVVGIYGVKDISDTLKKRYDGINYIHFTDYRNILFVPTKDGKANDLLFDSPDYPVLGLTSEDQVFEEMGKTTVVCDAHKLSELLEYFNYPKHLTYDDILRIKCEMFSPEFFDQNCEVFGYKRLERGGYDTVPDYKLSSDYAELLFERVNRFRSIRLIGSFVVRGFPQDTYKPHKEERQAVRSLKR